MKTPTSLLRLEIQARENNIPYAYSNQNFTTLLFPFNEY